MRTIRRSKHSRYCILTLLQARSSTSKRLLYFIRVPVQVMKRICPLQTHSDAFYRRNPSQVFRIDARHLDVPSRQTLMAFLGVILSGRPVSMESKPLTQLVILLDYMGCEDQRIWDLLAQSIHFDAFESGFLNTLQTIASWCDYRWIANLAACSQHPIPLHLFARNSTLYQALMCIRIEKNACDIPNEALESKAIDLDLAFPGWKIKTLIQHTHGMITGAIAGGSVCGLLAGFRGSDIDLFLWNMTQTKLKQFVNTVKLIHPQVKYTASKRFLVFTLESESIPLQVIPMRQSYTGAGLVHFFDLDPCCCFIPWSESDANIYIHPRAQIALETRSMDLRNAHRCPKATRVAKYESRGFAPVCRTLGIFARLQEFKSSEYSYNVDNQSFVYSLSQVEIIDNWFQIDVDYGLSVKCVTKVHWVNNLVDDFKTIYKPWCKDLIGDPLVLVCTTKSRSFCGGYQIVFGMKKK